MRKGFSVFLQAEKGMVINISWHNGSVFLFQILMSVNLTPVLTGYAKTHQDLSLVNVLLKVPWIQPEPSA